jgi:hypothetical protein
VAAELQLADQLASNAVATTKWLRARLAPITTACGGCSGTSVGIVEARGDTVELTELGQSLRPLDFVLLRAGRSTPVRHHFYGDHDV